MQNKIILKSTILLAAFTLFSTLLLGCVGADVQARKWNATDSCWGHEQDAGTYGSWFSGCDQAEAIAKDSQGNYWKFKNMCVPDDYTVINTPEISHLAVAELCNE